MPVGSSAQPVVLAALSDAGRVIAKVGASARAGPAFATCTSSETAPAGVGSAGVIDSVGDRSTSQLFGPISARPRTSSGAVPYCGVTVPSGAKVLNALLMFDVM